LDQTLVRPVETLISARWVVPVVPRGSVLVDHSVAIEHGRIVAVLPTAQARSQLEPEQHIQLPQHALAPGLINAHAHAAMNLLRGAGDDLPLGRWLNERIWPLERALMSERFVYDGTRHAAAEMLRAGITCCNDMYFFPEAAARAFMDLGMRCVVGIIAIEFPSAYATDADDYLRKGLQTRDALREEPLVSFALAPHAPYTVADPTLARIAVLAEELDLPVHIHVHETDAEIAESVRQHGTRPLARLARLGLVTERLLAVHAVHLQPDEIALLGQRGVSVAHCPASNLKLASGIAPVAALLRQGVGVAFGTDGAASNNRLDLFEEMRLAALLAKAAAMDASALPAVQALECATIAAAGALGLRDRIGSIEVGKQADLIAVDLSSLETQPCFDVASQLVYCAGREHVASVWVGGRRVVAEQRLVHGAGEVDVASIAAAGAFWQARIQKELTNLSATSNTNGFTG
jgi:5-methylthioadenosine/S-adenosylhomocysteine deaminase